MSSRLFKIATALISSVFITATAFAQVSDADWEAFSKNTNHQQNSTPKPSAPAAPPPSAQPTATPSTPPAPIAPTAPTAPTPPPAPVAAPSSQIHTDTKDSESWVQKIGLDKLEQKVTPADSAHPVELKDSNIGLVSQDVPLGKILPDAKAEKKKEKPISSRFQVRKNYDYRNKELPKFFQNAEYAPSNKHLPKFLYQGDYNKLLLDAVNQSNISAVDTIITRGGDINANLSQTGFTPLMLAAKANDNAMVKYLVLRGADLNKVNTSKQSALHLAAINNNINVMTLLLDYGANDKLTDTANKTAPDYLDPRIRKNFVLSRMKNISEKNKALLEYSSKGDASVVHYLLESGALVNYQDPHKNTALITAASIGHYKTVAVLIESGANPIVCNDSGTDAFRAALKSGNKDVIKLIETSIAKNELETGIPYRYPMLRNQPQQDEPKPVEIKQEPATNNDKPFFLFSWPKPAKEEITSEKLPTLKQDDHIAPIEKSAQHPEIYTAPTQIEALPEPEAPSPTAPTPQPKLIVPHPYVPSSGNPR